VKTPRILLDYRLFFQFLSYSASVIKDISYSTDQKKPNRVTLDRAHYVSILHVFLFLFCTHSISVPFPLCICSESIPFPFCIRSISVLYPFHSHYIPVVSVPFLFPFVFPVRLLLISTVHPNTMPFLWLLTALTVLSSSSSVMFKKPCFP